MFRQLILTALTAVTLSACQHTTQLPVVTHQQSISTQAALPPNLNPTPCGVRTQAALPPDYTPPTHNPCSCRQQIRTHAFLPPDASNPTKPICSQ